MALALALGLGVASSSAFAQEAEVPALRAAAQASPKEAAASLALGKALRRAGRTDEAAKELQRGAGLPGASLGAKLPGIRLELARARIDLHDAKGALLACEGVAGAGAKALAGACRAEAYLLQNRAALALPETEKALLLEPGLYEAMVASGRAHALEGMLAEADSELRAAAASADGRSDAHAHLGLVLMSEGKRDAGLGELRRARQVDPGDPDAALFLGLVLGMTKEAREALSAAAAIRPTHAPSQAALGLVALELGDLAAADAAATAAARLDPGLYAARVALGRVRVAQARWDDALKEGEAAKKIVPNAAAGDLIMADAFAGKGEIDPAIDAYQRAQGLDHGDPAPLVRAARACRVAGRYTTGRGFAEKATLDFPKWAPAWVELGDIAVLDKDKAKALASYRAALDADGPIDRDAVKKKLASLK